MSDMYASTVPVQFKIGGFLLLMASISCLLGAILVGGYLWRDYHLPDVQSEPQAAEIDEPLHAPTDGLNQETESAAPVHDYKIPAIADGLAPVLRRIPTKEPVVFLGIDDGANKEDFELQLLRDNNIKASLFLANRFIRNNPGFFNDFVSAGSLIENHTVNHTLLNQLSYEDQVKEICGQAALEKQQFGRRPILLRPPGGAYNQDTQRAAATCGMKAVVLWIAKANGGSMQYQIGHTLQAGDIVLMHFRPEFKDDLQAFIDASTSAGLHTELLEDWTQ